MARGVPSASASDWPRRTGNAPSLTSSGPFHPSNSSLLPMKRRWRGVAAPMKNESQKLLWLGVITAGPVAGMCSAPLMLSRNQTRKKLPTTARTRA